MTNSLGDRIDWLKEMAIRMDQSSKDGKIICSTGTMSTVLTEVAKCLETIKKDLDVLIVRK